MRTRLMTIALVAMALLVASAMTPSARAATHGKTHAGPASPRGLAGVRTASLRQRGRHVFWRVALVHPLSARGVRRGRRSLCLLLERRGSGAADGQLCLTPAAGRGEAGGAGRPPTGRGLGLTYATVRGTRVGPARRVTGSASLTKGGGIVLVGLDPTALGRTWTTLRWQVQSTAAGAGCPASGSGPPTCTVLFPARRHPLARLHVPRLVGCVPHGPAVIYGGPSTKREIALTFDDGPWGEPPSIDFVNLLHRLDVPATFFEIGSQLHEFDPTGSVQRTMLADGDMIGNHTWTHPDLESLSPATQTSQLALTDHAIRAATGFEPCLWRPPYGDVNGPLESLASNLGLLTIYWDDDTRDWSLPGTGAIISTALSEAHNGSIILMHFGGGPRYETFAAIPTIVHDLRARGYELVNLAQLLGLREIWR